MRKELVTEESLRELHGEKSNLLMEAQMFLGTDNPDEAIERFALAAPLEMRLARYYAGSGDKAMAARHRFSAAVCYAKSGSLRDALKLFEAMGRERETPEYKAEALVWVARLRQLQRETLQPYGHSLQSAA